MRRVIEAGDPSRLNGPVRGEPMRGAARGDRRRVPVPLPSDPVAARELVRAAQRRRKRMLARRRRAAAAIAMVIAVALVGAGLARRLWDEVEREPVRKQQRDDSAGERPQGGAAGRHQASATPDTTAGGPGPARGAGTFTHATSTGQVIGGAGGLKRYRVAVENGAEQDVEAFAVVTDQVLGDPRGWTAGGQLRFQRVGEQAPADFTIFLATPATSEQMCAAAGLHTAQYSSCRTAGKVIVNLARWRTGVPDYGAPLTDYRAYVLNHEIGHELGNGHEACPGNGRPAPVMQQQTYGLRGCVANAWPFVDGQRYTGPKVP